MKRAIHLLTLSLMLTGCAAQLTATKADMTNFRRDNFECSRMSERMVVGPLIALPFMQMAAQKQVDKMMTECMEIRGYTITERQP